MLYNLYLVFILTKGTTRCCSSRKYNQYQDFKLAGAQLKKLRRAEVGAKKFGVFRVKNHDFRPKNNILSNFKGGAPWIRPCIPFPSRIRGRNWLLVYPSRGCSFTVFDGVPVAHRFRFLCCVFCFSFFVLCLVYPILRVSLDCPFVIAFGFL